jgi:hypothetical protein
MSVLTKGLAMDLMRQGRKFMAITSIWPASVSIYFLYVTTALICWQSIESAATSKHMDSSTQRDLRKAVS